LIVILGHALLAAWDGVPSENGLYQLVINCQMILLMFISGISAGFSFPSERPVQFIWKKTCRLLVPYVIWAELYAVLNAAACGQKLTVSGLVEALYASKFWFLRYLYILYVVLFLVDIVYLAAAKILHCSDAGRRKLLLIVLLLSVAPVHGLSRVPYLNQSVSIWFYLWFLFGYAVYTGMGWIHRNIVLFEGAGTLAVDAMLIVIVIAVAGSTMRSQIQGSIMVLGICFSCYFLCKHIHGKLADIFCSLGKNTLPIYAVHWCLFFAPLYNNGTFQKWITAVSLPYALQVLIIFLFLLIATLVVVRLLSIFKITRILLLGERS
jgi:fucose 4-O-acetylase-like acetyltransferase